MSKTRQAPVRYRTSVAPFKVSCTASSTASSPSDQRRLQFSDLALNRQHTALDLPHLFLQPISSRRRPVPPGPMRRLCAAHALISSLRVILLGYQPRLQFSEPSFDRLQGGHNLVHLLTQRIYPLQYAVHGALESCTVLHLRHPLQQGRLIS